MHFNGVEIVLMETCYFFIQVFLSITTTKMQIVQSYSYYRLTKDYTSWINIEYLNKEE